jgi:TonB family protein
MNAIITYLFSTIVSLGVFYAAFAIFLRKEPLFVFNRVYLLSVLALSFLIPVLIFVPEYLESLFLKSAKGVFLYSFTLPAVEITSSEIGNASFLNVFNIVYLSGIAFSLARLIIRLLKIYKLSTKGEKTLENNTKILWSQSNIPPFSFYRTMYLPLTLKGSIHLSEIMRHEQTHIRSLHSFDILFTQLMQAVFWFNPFIVLIEKALREIHEFEADQAVIHAGTDPVAYTKILFSQNKVAQAIILGNNFNYSLIKRRLTMFYKKSTRYARLKAAVALPIAICIVMIYTISCTQTTKKSENGTKDSTTVGKVTMTTDSTGKEVAKVTMNGSKDVPPPPPPPPPPPQPPAAKDKLNANDVYTVVDNMPTYPGGDQARVDYMIKNIKYPKAAKEKGVQGTVYVSFVVEKDGSIREAKVIRGIGYSCDEEALRVIKGMPAWTPGTQNGKAVRVQFNMPVKFKLAE